MLLLVFLPQIVLYGVGLVATGSLHAERRFTWPAAAPIANNVVVIVAYVVVLAAVPRRLGAGRDRTLTPAEVAVLAGGTTLGVVALTDGAGRGPAASRASGSGCAGSRAMPKVRRLARHGGWAVVQVLATQVVLIVVLVLANAVEGGVVAFQFALTFFLLPVRARGDARRHGGVPGAQPLAERHRTASPPTAGRSIVAMAALLLPASAAASPPWPGRSCAWRPSARRRPPAWPRWPTPSPPWRPACVGYGLVLLLTRAGYARGDARTPALVVLAALGAGGAWRWSCWRPRWHRADRVTVLAAVHSAAYLAAAGVLWWLLDRRLAPARFGAARTVAGLAGAAVVAAGVVMGVAGVVARRRPAGSRPRWCVVGAGAVGLARLPRRRAGSRASGPGRSCSSAVADGPGDGGVDG